MVTLSYFRMENLPFQNRSGSCSSCCRTLFPKDRIAFHRLTANSAITLRSSVVCKYVNNTLEVCLCVCALNSKFVPVLCSVVKFVCAVQHARC